MQHESGTVAAADAYYRATGRIAVASTTYGPGFTNSLTARSEALGVPDFLALPMNIGATLKEAIA